jgi:CBS domain-containing protein
MHIAIADACRANFGALDAQFLCRSVSSLEPRTPITVRESETIEAVLRVLRAEKIGCVVVVNDQGKLSGIFSERDVVLKLSSDLAKWLPRPIAELMTKDPVCQSPDTTVAFCLNLMSSGGFRHLPIVDDELMPIGMLSVKDVVDAIVSGFVDELLAFEVEKPTP